MRNPKRSFFESAQSYLQRLAAAEYRAGMRAHTKAGRTARTYRHVPSQYHANLVELLGQDDEAGFKALKNECGYASKLGV